LYSEEQPDIEDSEPPEPTEAESSEVDHLEVQQIAADQATEELDTKISKVENPVETEPTLEEPEPQPTVKAKASPEKKTPQVNKKSEEVTTTQSLEKPETSTIYINHTELSDSKSPVSKTEPTQASDAESTPRESRLPLNKPGHVQHDDQTTAMSDPDAKQSSKSETTDSTDMSQSTDQSGEKAFGTDKGSNPFFSALRSIDVAKKKKITVPVKTETIAIPLYHLIPKPHYPSRSRDLGEEGTVIIVILVGTNGMVKEAKLSKSSGFSLLDGSALATVREKWQFKPGTRNGKPIESRVRVPIKFSIKDF